jgi:type IV pilus assembly protein PilB
MYSNEKYLLELLLESGLVTDRDIQGVVSTQKHGESTLETLIKTGVVSDEQLAQTVAVNSGMEYVDLYGFEAPPSLKSLVPVETAIRYKIAPLGTNGSALQILRHLMLFRMSCSLRLNFSAPLRR